MSYLMAMLSVNYLPLSIATPALMSAVFVTLILGYYVADEQLSRQEIATIVFGFIGVLLVVNPFQMDKDVSSVDGNQSHSQKREKYEFFLGIIFTAGFTVCSAMKYISIRAIGDNVHTSVKNYYFGLTGSIFTLALNLYLDPGFFAIWRLGQPTYSMTPDQFWVILIVGILGWLSQETLAQGLSTVKSGTMAAFQNIAIIMGFLIDIFYYKRQICWNEYLGSGIIIFFTCMQSYYSHLDNYKENEERI